MTASELSELLTAALRDVDELVVGEPPPPGPFLATVRVRGRGGFLVVVEQLFASPEARA